MNGTGCLHCSAAQLAQLDPEAVKGKRASPYGVQALVLRDAVPAGFNVSPVGIEGLFVFMVKGDLVMKGLLLKDLYMAAKYCRAFLLIVVVFLAVSFFRRRQYLFCGLPCHDRRNRSGDADFL